MMSHEGEFVRFIASLSHKLLKGMCIAWYFAPGWGFLTTSDEHMLSHPLTRIFAPWSNPYPLPTIPSPPRGLQ